MCNTQKLKDLILKYDADNLIDSFVNFLSVNGCLVADTNVVSPENRPLIQTVADMPLNEVVELIKAKREGRTIVPPCEVGDMLYDIYGCSSPDDIRQLKVKEIHVRLDERNKPWMIIGGYYYSFDDFGKNVFKNKEDAINAIGKEISNV